MCFGDLRMVLVCFGVGADPVAAVDHGDRGPEQRERGFHLEPKKQTSSGAAPLRLGEQDRRQRVLPVLVHCDPRDMHERFCGNAGSRSKSRSLKQTSRRTASSVRSSRRSSSSRTRSCRRGRICATHAPAGWWVSCVAAVAALQHLETQATRIKRQERRELLQQAPACHHLCASAPLARTPGTTTTCRVRGLRVVPPPMRGGNLRSPSQPMGPGPARATQAARALSAGCRLCRGPCGR